MSTDQQDHMGKAHGLDNIVYLTARQVRARYGNASAMWITRRLAQDGFPAPCYRAGSRFWRVADLDTWDAEQDAKPKTTRQRDMAAVRAARQNSR